MALTVPAQTGCTFPQQSMTAIHPLILTTNSLKSAAALASAISSPLQSPRQRSGSQKTDAPRLPLLPVERLCPCPDTCPIRHQRLRYARSLTTMFAPLTDRKVAERSSSKTPSASDERDISTWPPVRCFCFFPCSAVHVRYRPEGLQHLSPYVNLL